MQASCEVRGIEAEITLNLSYFRVWEIKRMLTNEISSGGCIILLVEVAVLISATLGVSFPSDPPLFSLESLEKINAFECGQTI